MNRVYWKTCSPSAWVLEGGGQGSHGLHLGYWNLILSYCNFCKKDVFLVSRRNQNFITIAPFLKIFLPIYEKIPLFSPPLKKILPTPMGQAHQSTCRWYKKNLNMPYCEFASNTFKMGLSAYYQSSMQWQQIMLLFCVQIKGDIHCDNLNRLKNRFGV